MFKINDKQNQNSFNNSKPKIPSLISKKVNRKSEPQNAWKIWRKEYEERKLGLCRNPL